jgi:alpha-beta hydrolase superfamily lysophospholipase
MKSEKIPAKQSLMRFRADDGFLITAMMVTPDNQQSEEIRDIPILLQIHGSLGHFLARGTPRLLPQALLERGYSSLSINTRLANAGQMTGQGIFPDTIKDIDAAVGVLVQEGFRNIFILGYSLGASMLVHWAANRNHSSIRGLVLEGCLYSSAASQRKRFETWGAIPSYEEVYAQAKEVLGDDPYGSENDETLLVYQSKGPSHEPINDEIFTYKTWWFMEGPEAHAAMAHEHIGRITVPVLMMRGERDHMVEAWELDALAKILQSAGNPDVRAIEVSGAGHDCMENSEAMLHEIVQMFARLVTER